MHYHFRKIQVRLTLTLTVTLTRSPDPNPRQLPCAHFVCTACMKRLFPIGKMGLESNPTLTLTLTLALTLTLTLPLTLFLTLTLTLALTVTLTLILTLTLTRQDGRGVPRLPSAPCQVGAAKARGRACGRGSCGAHSVGGARGHFGGGARRSGPSQVDSGLGTLWEICQAPVPSCVGPVKRALFCDVCV